MIDELYHYFKSFKTVCYASIFTLISSFLRLLDSLLILLKDFKDNKQEEYLAFEDKFKSMLISGMVIYSLVWSFGLSVDTSSRKMFDQAFKKVIMGDITANKKKKNVSFP